MLFPLLLLSAAALADPAGPAGPAPRPPARPTVFSGHLAHAPAGDTVRLFVGERRYRQALSPAGNFRFVFPRLSRPTPVQFEYARQTTQLYLLPGLAQRLTLDFRDFDKTVRYSGSGAALSNYLARSLYRFEFGPDAGAVRPTRLFQPGTTPARFRRAADAYRRARLAFMADYARTHPLPAGFRRDQAFFIQLDWATQLLEFVGYRRGQRPDSAVVPAAYFDFLRQPFARQVSQYLDVRGLVEHTRVGSFLYNYQQRLAPTGRLSRDPADGERLYELATSELGDGPARDQALEQLISWKTEEDLPGAMALYPTWRRHNRDSTLARTVRKGLTLAQRLAVGQPAPDFTLPDASGRLVSLRELRGKVVYLDFWGVWCAPCVRELREASPALRQHFAARPDVVFLYVSVNDPEARWLQALQALADPLVSGPNGIHLRQPPDGHVAENYQLNSFPSHWLIGRDGRIISRQAPRPSEKEQAIATIEQALK